MRFVARKQVRFGSNLPEKAVMHHRWVTTRAFNTSNGTFYDLVFRANSVYDPDNTTSPGQASASLFKLMSGLYDRYTVIGSKIKFTMMNANTGATCGHFQTAILTNGYSTTSYASVDQAAFDTGCSRPKTTMSVWGGTVNYNSWSLRRYRGYSAISNPTNDGGGATTNPGEQWYFHCLLQNLSGFQNPIGVICRIEISYIVVWTERRSALIQDHGEVVEV